MNFRVSWHKFLCCVRTSKNIFSKFCTHSTRNLNKKFQEIQLHKLPKEESKKTITLLRLVFVLFVLSLMYTCCRNVVKEEIWLWLTHLNRNLSRQCTREHTLHECLKSYLIDKTIKVKTEKTYRLEKILLTVCHRALNWVQYCSLHIRNNFFNFLDKTQFLHKQTTYLPQSKVKK